MRKGDQSENDSSYFILICDSERCPAEKRGYFWRHPFRAAVSPAHDHFSGHLTEEEMIKKYGWHGE